MQVQVTNLLYFPKYDFIDFVNIPNSVFCWTGGLSTAGGAEEGSWKGETMKTSVHVHCGIPCGSKLCLSLYS